MQGFSNFQLAATVEDRGHKNRLVFDDTAAYMEFVNSKAGGERVIVSFEDEQDIRSLAANRFLWGVVYRAIFEQTGTPKEATHDEMCELFLRKHIFYVDKKTGLTVERWIRSGSSGLTPKAFHEFVEQVIAHAAIEFGVEIDSRDPDYTTYRRAFESKPSRRKYAA